MPATPATTVPQQNLQATQEDLSATALEGLDQEIRKNRELQDFRTQVNAAQKYTHQQTVQRAAEWTR
jgi:hypothetical protein